MSQTTVGTREQIQETSVESVASVADLHKQVANLTRLVTQQQGELEALRGRVEMPRATPRSRGRAASARGGGRASSQMSSPASSRRSLLRWGGAAAAAAMALAVGEQAVRAAPANNNDPITAGNTTTATNPTTLSYSGASTAFAVNAPNNAAAINGTAFGMGNGIGVAGNGGDAGQGVHGESGLYGVYGLSFANGFGVYGTDTSTNGIGVYGLGALYGVGGEVTNNTTGVNGLAGSQGNGVVGSATGGSGYGVWGRGNTGYGLVGEVSTGVDVSVGGATGSGRLQQRTQLAAGAPTSGSYFTGEQIRDHNGDLYICVFGGSPGTWKKVAAIPAGAAGGASVFFATPYRIFDTRGLAGVPFNNGVGNNPMNPGQILTLPITGTVDPGDSSIVVPTGATGIIGNLIAITPAGEGFLGIQPSTGVANSRAWVNYEANVSIDNAVLVGLSSAGKIDIQCSTAKSGAALTITGYII